MTSDAGAGWPLTAAQAGMWFAQQMEPSNPIFCGGLYVDIAGAVDEDMFVAAVRRAAQEAETCHVRFVMGDDGPLQVPHEHELPVPVLDMSAEPDPVASAREWMWADMARPVDLATDTFYSTALIKVAADRYLWYQRAHHIIADGYASSLVAGRLAQIYTAMAAGESVEDGAFGPLASLIEDDLAYRASDQRAIDRSYWLERLAGHPGAAGLTETTALPAHTFIRETAEISAETRDRISALARAAHTSWSVVMCTAMALYLNRVRGVDVPVVGLPVAARFGADMFRTPGMVANILPLPVHIEPDMSVVDLIRRTAAEIKAALRHQRYRFEDLRRDLRLNAGQRIFGPTVDVLLYQGELSFAGHPGSVEILSNGPVEDLNVAVYSGDNIAGLRVCLDANPRLYSVEEVRTHRDRFALLLENLVVADPEQPVGTVPILFEDELAALLTGWQGETRAIPEETIAEQFAAQAARTPDAVAVTGDGPTLTYAELDRRSNQLARHLLAAGAGPDQYVAVAMERTTELLVALLGTLKAGAAYVPIDLTYPADRIRYMIEETAPAAVLTTSTAAPALPATCNVPRVLLDDASTAATIAGHLADPIAADERNRAVHPLQPAYVVFTSGSTGRPKGVVVQHRAMSDIIAWAVDRIGRDALRHVLAATSLGFDPSVLELFAPLVSGGRIELLGGPLELGGRSRTGGYVGTVPSIFGVLADGPGFNAQTDTIGFTGETLNEEVVAQVRKALPTARIANLYGPTEVGIYCTAWFSDEHEGVPTVGRPLPNTRVYVLDDRLRLVPPGVEGEIYVAAEGLAAGYLRRPELTAERFLADPFGSGGRMYRTGDRGRRRPDGVLEYRGRTDYQVKIRGFRVELAEIECALMSDEDVARAAVMLHPDGALIGYVVPAPERALDPEAVLDRLRGIVPGYMVPASLLVLDELPRTPSGKLDRKLLPVPDTTGLRPSREPRNEHERILCAIVAELVGRTRVGVEDNFFDVGANSLLVTKFISRVRNALGVELEIRDIFDSPSVAQLVQHHIATAEPARPRLVPRQRAAAQEARR